MFYWVEEMRVLYALRKWVVGATCSVALLVSGLVSAAPGPESKSIEFWDDYEERSLINVNHDPWQAILNRYLDDTHPSGINRFDYAGVTEVDLQRLADYLDYLQLLEPRQLNRSEQLAYWINLYNAKTVEIVIRSYQNGDEVSSIRQIRSGVFTAGPWERESVKISQQDLSLDNIEHGILRPHWQDHRLHFVLNCASLGCPNLLKTAFDGDNNEALLNGAEQAFMQHPRAARIENGQLVLSSLFDWYGKDFADDEAGMLAYLRKHVSPEVAGAIGAAGGPEFEYDWDLNKPDS
ncbi:DUF547 domain-containing protein [Arenicella chitinivorans]|uniref:DUF547 domain-containing protein n=1 Tax=Arenicella chitinivorans TaxID=1329800 RepID=A0A918VJA4_9GAMM|nr:DUF547 domain-containing protein [Arenicella chitinivorans]GHA03458.1 DUF547 domain-containing protein [Arenicella chitinivorans]